MEDPYPFFANKISIDEMISTHLVNIIADDENPEYAALFANVVAETYRDKNLERASLATDEALLWLGKQQEVYRQKNFQSEKSVEEYKAEHGLFSLDDRTVSSDTLLQLQQQWSTAHTSREMVEAEVESYRRTMASGNVLSLADHLSKTRTVIEKSLWKFRALEQERASLGTTMLDKAPEVVRIDSELEAVRAQIRDEINDFIRGKEAEASVLRSQERRLGKAITSAQESMARQGQKMIPLKFLTASAERDQHFYETLDERMAELALQQFLRGNNVRLVTRALVPKAPYKPVMALNLLTGFFVGILGGIVVGVILDAIDTTVRSREDVEAAAGAPMLGLVPLVDLNGSGVNSETEGTIYSHMMPRSPLAECLRTVRTNIQFRWGQGELRSLLVTSASPKEGKSFISANLAAVMASSGKRVVIIDADLRRPSLHKRFGLGRARGLVNFINGEGPITELAQRTTIPGVDMLAAGPNVNNPSELLQADSLRRVLNACAEAYDLAIVDSPPVNVVSDALVIASTVDRDCVCCSGE